jgi:hypothetical protein
MRGITLDFGGATVLHRNQNSAGIGAIVRTGGVDHSLHEFDYKVPPRLQEKSINHGGHEVLNKGLGCCVFPLCTFVSSVDKVLAAPEKWQEKRAASPPLNLKVKFSS